jgi:hypothetical protein
MSHKLKVFRYIKSIFSPTNNLGLGLSMCDGETGDELHVSYEYSIEGSILNLSL